MNILPYIGDNIRACKLSLVLLRMFIGSSVTGYAVAQYIRSNIERTARISRIFGSLKGTILQCNVFCFLLNWSKITLGWFLPTETMKGGTIATKTATVLPYALRNV